MKVPLWVTELAREFWIEAKEVEPFPRDLRGPIGNAVPLSVKLLPSLSVTTVLHWLSVFEIECTIQGRDRPLKACLVACQGCGFAFVDAGDSEAERRFAGDIRLGMVVGHKNVVVGVPSELKSVLPRHTAVLGTTGGGKSTTIARLVQQAQTANLAVILLDVEGEYTKLHEPTSKPDMLAALHERGLHEAGISEGMMTLYHLVGRGTANPEHPNLRTFSLQFARLSPYAATEIMGLTEPQEQRFMRAYDIAKEVVRELGIFPVKSKKDETEKEILEGWRRAVPEIMRRFHDEAP